jgi:ABC-type multidrug transport system fused ATPase/permease subunit
MALRTYWYLFLQLRKWSKSFVIVVILKTIAIWIISICILAIANEQKCHEDFGQDFARCNDSYIIHRMVLFLCFSSFQLVHGIDGIMNDNLYELYTSMGFALALTALMLIRFVRTKSTWEEYGNAEWALLATILLAQIYDVIAAWPLYKECSWRWFRRLGADKKVRYLYRLYLLFLTVLKFDLMLAIINTLTSGPALINKGVPLVLDVLNIIITALFFVFGWLGMKFELPWMIILFFCLSPTEVAFVIGWLVKTIVDNRFSEYNDWNDRAIAWMFLVTGVLAMIVRLLLLLMAIILFRHFGEGLKEALEREREARSSRRKRLLKRNSIAAINFEDGDVDIIYDGPDDNLRTENLTLEDVIAQTQADVYVKM